MNLALPEYASDLLGSVIGAAAPRLNGLRLNYRQNRFERHVKAALETFLQRIEFLESNYNVLNDEVKKKFNGEYLEWLLDNLDNEKQQEKIKCHVNGYINLMNNDANDNLMLMFFNTVNELTRLDIDVLQMYAVNPGIDIQCIKEKYKIEYEQVSIIKEKLARLGLLSSRVDEQRDTNTDKIVEYIAELAKQQKKSRVIEVKIPKLDKVNRSGSYRITKLGKSYLEIMDCND